MKLGGFDVSEQKGLFTFYCEGESPHSHSYSASLAPNVRIINGIKKRVYSQMAEGLIPPSRRHKTTAKQSLKCHHPRASQPAICLPTKRPSSQLLKEGGFPPNIVMMSLDVQEQRKNSRRRAHQSRRYHSCGGELLAKNRPSWTPLEQACMQIYSRSPTFLNQLDVMKVKQLLEPKKNFLMQLHKIKTKESEVKSREIINEDHLSQKQTSIEEQIYNAQKQIRLKIPRMSLLSPIRQIKVNTLPKVEELGDLSPFQNQRIRKQAANISNYPPSSPKQSALVDKYHLIKFTKRLQAWKKAQSHSHRGSEDIKRLLINREPLDLNPRDLS